MEPNQEPVAHRLRSRVSRPPQETRTSRLRSQLRRPSSPTPTSNSTRTSSTAAGPSTNTRQRNNGAASKARMSVKTSRTTEAGRRRPAAGSDEQPEAKRTRQDYTRPPANLRRPPISLRHRRARDGEGTSAAEEAGPSSSSARSPPRTAPSLDDDEVEVLRVVSPSARRPRRASSANPTRRAANSPPMTSTPRDAEGGDEPQLTVLAYFLDGMRGPIRAGEEPVRLEQAEVRRTRRRLARGRQDDLDLDVRVLLDMSNMARLAHTMLLGLVDRMGENGLSQGLSQADVDKVPLGSPPLPLGACSICINDFACTDQIRLFPCHHNFHKICADQWLKQKNNCPICRQIVFTAS